MMFIQDTPRHSCARHRNSCRRKTAKREFSDPYHGAINIPALLGPRSWFRLPLAVRNRFSKPVAVGETLTYHGTMHEVRASRAGKLMALLARFAGAPVAHLTGSEIPCEVKLFHDSKRGGTVWQRIYHFAGKTVHAQTTKKAGSDGTSLECFGSALGFGAGMVLDIFEADSALHFASRTFFVQLFGLRVPLSKFLNPGKLVVTHRDKGDGAFQFLMVVSHPQLGEVLYQDGTFHDPIDLHDTE